MASGVMWIAYTLTCIVVLLPSTVAETHTSCASSGFYRETLPCSRCDALQIWLAKDSGGANKDAIADLTENCKRCCSDEPVAQGRLNPSAEAAMASVLAQDPPAAGGDGGTETKKLYAKAVVVVDRGRLSTDQYEGLREFLEVREEVGKPDGEGKNVEIQVETANLGGSSIKLFGRDGQQVNEYFLDGWSHKDLKKFLSRFVE